jgi:hypothetical protein
MGGLTIDLLDQAAEAVDWVAQITGRARDEVMSDALRTYLWILHEQSQGRKIMSLNGGRPRALENFVEKKDVADKYFRELGWIT